MPSKSQASKKAKKTKTRKQKPKKNKSRAAKKNGGSSSNSNQSDSVQVQWAIVYKSKPKVAKPLRAKATMPMDSTRIIWRIGAHELRDISGSLPPAELVKTRYFRCIVDKTQLLVYGTLYLPMAIAHLVGPSNLNEQRREWLEEVSVQHPLQHPNGTLAYLPDHWSLTSDIFLRPECPMRANAKEVAHEIAESSANKSRDSKHEDRANDPNISDGDSNSSNEEHSDGDESTDEDDDSDAQSCDGSAESVFGGDDGNGDDGMGFGSDSDNENDDYFMSGTTGLSGMDGGSGDHSDSDIDVDC
jgi:hypothetical protein